MGNKQAVKASYKNQEGFQTVPNHSVDVEHPLSQLVAIDDPRLKQGSAHIKKNSLRQSPSIQFQQPVKNQLIHKNQQSIIHYQSDQYQKSKIQKLIILKGADQMQNFAYYNKSPEYIKKESTSFSFQHDYSLLDKFFGLFDGQHFFKGWHRASLRHDFKVFEEQSVVVYNDFSDYIQNVLPFAGMGISLMQVIYGIKDYQEVEKINAIINLVYACLALIFQGMIIWLRQKRIQENLGFKVVYLILVLSTNNVAQILFSKLSPEEFMVQNSFSLCWVLNFSDNLQEFFIYYLIIFASNIVSIIFNNLKQIELIILHMILFFPSFIAILKKSMKQSEIFMQFKETINQELNDQKQQYDQILKNLIVFKLTKSIIAQHQSNPEGQHKKISFRIEIMEIGKNLVKRLIDQTKYLKKFRTSKKDLYDYKAQDAKFDICITKDTVKKVKKADFLQDKIYIPYLISNNTILQYEKKHHVKMSLSSILIDQYELNNGSNMVPMNKNSVLYFRVPKGKPTETIPQQEQEQQGTGSSHSLSSDESEQEKRMAEEIKNQEELHMDEDSLYFELEFEIFGDNAKDDEQSILLYIRDITQIVQSQQKRSDKIYQDAIEANYSHEQMTPLNSILANSKIVIRRVEELIQFQEKYQNQVNKVENLETLLLLKSIKFSGKIMWYYNKNQITKMKINKQEFQSQFSITKMPEEFIKQVLKPFSPMIKRRELNVHIIRTNDFEGSNLKADWKSFQLSIFNLIQNAVKYNKYRGDLIFVLSLTPIQQFFKEEKFDRKQTQEFFKAKVNDDFIKINPNYIVEIEIIDSGVGIEKEQQKYLFIPFLELKVKQDMKNVKNNSIGMGLSCSKMIMKQLKGKLELVESQRGRTVFKLQMPVEKQDIILEEISVNQNQQSCENHMVLFNFKRPLQNQILEYMMPKVELEPDHMSKIAKQSIEMGKYPDTQEAIPTFQQNNKLQKSKVVKIPSRDGSDEPSLSNETSFRSKSNQSELFQKAQSNYDLSHPIIDKVNSAIKQQKNNLISEKERIRATRKMSTANAPIRGLVSQLNKRKISRKILNRSRTIMKRDVNNNQDSAEIILNEEPVKIIKDSKSISISDIESLSDSIFGNMEQQNQEFSQVEEVKETNRVQAHHPIMFSGNDNFSSYKAESVKTPHNQSHQFKKSKVDSLMGFKPVNRLNKFVKNRIGGGGTDVNNSLNERSNQSKFKLKNRGKSKYSQKNRSSDTELSESCNQLIGSRSSRCGQNSKKLNPGNIYVNVNSEASISGDISSRQKSFNIKNRTKKSVTQLSNCMFSEDMKLSSDQPSVSDDSAQVYKFKHRLQGNNYEFEANDQDQNQLDLINQQLKNSKKRHPKKLNFKQKVIDEQKQDELFYNHYEQLEGVAKQVAMMKYLQNQNNDVQPLDYQSSQSIYELDLDLESSGRLSFQIDMIIDREKSEQFSQESESREKQQEDLRMPKARKKQLEMERKNINIPEINSKNLMMFPISQQINFNVQNQRLNNYMVDSDEILEEVRNSEFEIDNSNNISIIIDNQQAHQQSRLLENPHLKIEIIRDLEQSNESSSIFYQNDKYKNILPHTDSNFNSAQRDNPNFLQLKSPVFKNRPDGGYLRKIKKQSSKSQHKTPYLQKQNQSSEASKQQKTVKSSSPNSPMNRALGNEFEASQNSAKVLSQSCMDISAILQNAQQASNNIKEYGYKRDKNQLNTEDELSLSDVDKSKSASNSLDSSCSEDYNFNVHYNIDEIQEDIREDEISVPQRVSSSFSQKFGSFVNNSNIQIQSIISNKQELLIRKGLSGLMSLKSIDCEEKNSSIFAINQSKQSKPIQSSSKSMNVRPPFMKNKGSSSKSKSLNSVAAQKKSRRKSFEEHKIASPLNHQNSMEMVIKQVLPSNNSLSKSQKRSRRSLSLSSKFSVMKKCDCEPRILAVDDNDFNLMPLQILIGHLFKIKTDLAFDGEQALEMFRESFQKSCQCANRSYKFIFMDLQMPTMDGYEASEGIIKIMADANQQDYCHIVALTSYTSNDVRERILAIGLKDLINKPLHANDLQRMVYKHFYRITEQEFVKKFPQLISKQPK